MRSLRKHKYGLSDSEFKAMLKAQSGKCAVCRRPQGGKMIAVDHCHKTGKVRGLLCSNCNMGIGLLQDSPKLLRKAAKYLG